MILLPCPHCGPRNTDEFSHHGEHGERPDADRVTARQWRSYLYLRRNQAGWTTELWLHGAGCGRYVLFERHTVTNEVRAAHSTGGR
jgi:heterotetrameric sarcosine oxidase delta subunit